MIGEMFRIGLAAIVRLEPLLCTAGWAAPGLGGDQLTILGAIALLGLSGKPDSKRSWLLQTCVIADSGRCFLKSSRILESLASSTALLKSFRISSTFASE
jgi:hypothetical protein